MIYPILTPLFYDLLWLTFFICLALPSLLTLNLDKIQKKAQQTEIDALKASIETLKASMETLEGENLSLKQKVCIDWNGHVYAVNVKVELI